MTEGVEHSAGGVVVRRMDAAWHVLLIKDPYGNWGLPKGHIEGEERPLEAAVREVTEETGLTPDAVGPELDTIEWVFRRKGQSIQKYCTFYLMRSGQGDPEPQLDEGITECRWLPADAAAVQIVYENTRMVVENVPQALEALDW